jgi:hypothetical protein
LVGFRCGDLELFFWYVLQQSSASSTCCSDGEEL